MLEQSTDLDSLGLCLWFLSSTSTPQPSSLSCWVSDSVGYLSLSSLRLGFHWAMPGVDTRGRREGRKTVRRDFLLSEWPLAIPVSVAQQHLLALGTAVGSNIYLLLAPWEATLSNPLRNTSSGGWVMLSPHELPSTFAGSGDPQPFPLVIYHWELVALRSLPGYLQYCLLLF